jgi:hypothetical protein
VAYITIFTEEPKREMKGKEERRKEKEKFAMYAVTDSDKKSRCRST